MDGIRTVFAQNCSIRGISHTFARTCSLRAGTSKLRKCATVMQDSLLGNIDHSVGLAWPLVLHLLHLLLLLGLASANRSPGATWTRFFYVSTLVLLPFLIA